MKWLALLLLFHLCSAQTLSIFAASSLTEVFTDLATEFEAVHLGVTVDLQFAGSSILAAQIDQGAPADLFASADRETLLRVRPENAVTEFAQTRLIVAVFEQSELETLGDLAVKDYLLVLAHDAVPIGRYAREALTKLEEVYGKDYADSVLSRLVSLETNVRQAAAKVELGEVDATFIYEADKDTLQNVRYITLPDAYNVAATYAIAALETPKADLAQRFIDYVLSDEGQTILKGYGFSSLSD